MVNFDTFSTSVINSTGIHLVISTTRHMQQALCFHQEVNIIFLRDHFRTNNFLSCFKTKSASTTFQKSNVIAQITADSGNPASGQIYSNQLQTLLQQLHEFVNPYVNVNPQRQSTVNENGYMAPQYSSVLFIFPPLAFNFETIYLPFKTTFFLPCLEPFHIMP